MATLSITVPDTSVLRIRNAVAAITGVPAPASTTQVSDLVRAYLRDLCLQTERRVQGSAAVTVADTAVTAEFPPG